MNTLIAIGRSIKVALFGASRHAATTRPHPKGLSLRGGTAMGTMTPRRGRDVQISPAAPVSAMAAHRSFSDVMSAIAEHRLGVRSSSGEKDQ
jgi:hypothetical protein